MLAIRRNARLEDAAEACGAADGRRKRLAPVDDIQMWYAIFNKGGSNPVLLIHGGLVNADTWGNQVPVLAKTHQVIVADSRGHGRSTRSSKPFGYELMADDYFALLDYLKIDKVAACRLERRRHHRARHRHAPSRTPHQIVGVRREYGGHRLEGRFDKDPVFAAAIVEAGEDHKRVSPTPNEYDAFLAAISQMWNTQPDYRPEQIAKIVTPTVIVAGEYERSSSVGTLRRSPG